MLFPKCQAFCELHGVTWDLTACSLVEKYHPGLTCCLHDQGNWTVIFIFLLCTESAEKGTKFVEDGVRELLKARRVLCGSYVYGYYLEDNGYNKTIFEFMQVTTNISSVLLQVKYVDLVLLHKSFQTLLELKKVFSRKVCGRCSVNPVKHGGYSMYHLL